jgi:hypothetical protein
VSVRRGFAGWFTGAGKERITVNGRVARQQNNWPDNQKCGRCKKSFVNERVPREPRRPRFQ